MTFQSNNVDFDALIGDLSNLFKEKKKVTSPFFERDLFESQVQAPIKGTFYNSGDFSLASPNPKHPAGHLGVDLRASAGTPVYPMMPGIVSFVGTNPKGGNVITIQHPQNIKTYYAHLSTVNVRNNERVSNDTVIGTVGNTGNASDTFPHLHFQVWKNNQIQNPAQYFSIPKYSNVDKKKEKWWFDENAKINDASFNMKRHLSYDRKLSFIHDVNKLKKIAELYYKLSIKK